MSFDLRIKAGDLVIEKSDLGMVRGTEKLTQDLLKIAITPVGGNPLQPWYGSFISKTLIGNVLPTDIIFSMAKSQLQKSIENLKDLQNLQVSSGQKVTPDEQISYIRDINIIRNSIDPRVLQVFINVLSRTFGKVSATFNVSPNQG